MASVPNALGQPSVKFMQTARERTTTGPNAHRLMQYTTTPFSRAHLMAFYPLDRGKVIHAVSEVLLKGIRYHIVYAQAPRTCFREGSTLPLQQLEGDRCEIGSGGNGSVFLFKLSGECFAIKKVRVQLSHVNVLSVVIVTDRLSIDPMRCSGGHGLIIPMLSHCWLLLWQITLSTVRIRALAGRLCHKWEVLTIMLLAFCEIQTLFR